MTSHIGFLLGATYVKIIGYCGKVYAMRQTTIASNLKYVWNSFKSTKRAIQIITYCQNKTVLNVFVYITYTFAI